MNKKVTDIVSYIGIIGWFVAFMAGDKEGAKFHLNQSLVLVIFSCLVNSVAGLITWIPFIGTAISIAIGIFFLVFSIIGIVYACQEQEKELPLFGKIHIMY